MKETSLHITNMRIKQLCNRKVRDFAMALRPENVPGLSRNGPLDQNELKVKKFGKMQSGLRGMTSIRTISQFLISACHNIGCFLITVVRKLKKTLFAPKLACV